jgi:hypothetical protein
LTIPYCEDEPSSPLDGAVSTNCLVAEFAGKSMFFNKSKMSYPATVIA